MEQTLQVPILFILYNRLDTTRQAFAKIREVRPKKLYIACDGPKKDKEGDREKVEAVREWVLGAVDWDCQVKTRFSEENQGCRYGPANAISWVFENEEEAIILEDDIVAAEAFFWYCQEMLHRYRDDTRIMIVSGHKVVWDFAVEGDYFFTAFGPIWGWATWRRAWKYFDGEMKQWPSFKARRVLADIYGKEAAESLSISIDLAYSGKLDAWDYPWLFARASNSGLGILPKYNLVENIGYGEDATHSSGKAPDFHVGSLEFPLKPAENVIRNWEYDRAWARMALRSNRIRRMIRKLIPRPILRSWYRFRGVKV